MEEMIKDPEVVRRLAVEIFGEDMVDVHDFNGNLEKPSFKVDIHFPRLEITNSREHHHMLYDLYARLQVDYNEASPYRLGFPKLLGTRTTYSLKEVESGYCHSHLPTGSLQAYSEFCLGTSEFGDLLTTWATHGRELDWEMVFFALPRFLAWESREGIPYMYMSNIQYVNSGDTHVSRRVRTEDLNAELRRILPRIPLEVWNLTPDLSPIPDHPALLDALDEYSKIRSLTPHNAVTQSPTRTLAQLQEAERVLNHNRTFTFRGKQVPYRVFDESISPTEVATLEVAGRMALDANVRDYYIDYLKQTSQNYIKQRIYGLKAENPHIQKLRALSSF
jgi:hypothetical protein